MQKLSVFAFLFGAVFSLNAQQNYWQQKVEYTMNIDFDASNHQFKGTQHLVYYNQSPDTLNKVFYHLYYHAFQPGSSMDMRSRTIADPDRRVGDRIAHLQPNEIGYHKIKKMVVNGTEISSFKISGSILEVNLAKPILPKSKAVLYMEFESQVPVQIRRTGRNSAEGVDYSMTQWYPKICAYDDEGWHANPYIGREFYGPFGKFDVKISIDKNYVLAGTGLVQNPQEVGAGYQDFSKPLKEPKGDKKTWHFVAENVHDFAWAADTDYIHKVHKLKNGLVLHYLYLPDGQVENWEALPAYMEKFFEIINEKFGEYPYPQFSFVQGGDGGMEYPMLTLVTSKGGKLNGLISVCVHEALHNWYYGVLGTNEVKYPWMDEGFDTYAQNYVMNILLNQQKDNAQAGSMNDYIRLQKSGLMEPLSTHADFYQRNGVYSSSAYSAGAVFLNQLKYVVGEETFYKGMRNYFNEWKFKHPKPNDFIRVMEKTSNIELRWYLEQFVYSLNKVDYKIVSVTEENGKTAIILERVGNFPMPVDVFIVTKDNKTEVHNIPLDIMFGVKKEKYDLTYHTPWVWTYPQYKLLIDQPISSITQIVIDPLENTADVERNNNFYEFGKTELYQK